MTFSSAFFLPSETFSRSSTGLKLNTFILLVNSVSFFWLKSSSKISLSPGNNFFGRITELMAIMVLVAPLKSGRMSFLKYSFVLLIPKRANWLPLLWILRLKIL